MKFVSALTAIALLISSTLTYLFCPDNNAGLLWEETAISVFKAPEGSYVSYPRMLELSDGTLICAYDTDSRMACVRSSDGGITWTQEQTVIASAEGLSCANAALIEAENGELLCAYRANGTLDGRFYTSIRVSKSSDGGKSWSFHSTVSEETENDNGFFGLWEPHFGYIGDILAIFYSNDSQSGAVSSPSHQNIEFKLFENGKWSERYIASNGDVTRSRDGMPVWCKSACGEYVMVIEATTLRDSSIIPRGHIIRMLKSDDGINWERPRSIYVPPKYTDTSYAGAPYIVELPDGRLCVSFQTDAANAEGSAAWVCNVMTTKKPYRGRANMLSFTKPFEPFGNDNATLWNGMLVYGEHLLVFTTNVDESGSSIIMRRAKLI